MGKTSIEWSGFSVNPILARAEGSDATKGGYASGVGHYCEKISPGCARCYSSETQPRFGLPVFQEQRRGGIDPFFHAARLEEVLRRKVPTKFFWCDMTDMFGNWVPNEWIAACFGVMAATPQHTHQVLTKRAERMREWFAWAARDVGQPGVHVVDHATKYLGPEYLVHWDTPAWPLPNVWLGVSVENQKYADERIPLLLETPAAVRFISYEPALGPVDVASIADGAGGQLKPLVGLHWVPGRDGAGAPGMVLRGGQGPKLDWVIVGGESGHGARGFQIEWARSVVEQCREAGTACFVKQLGAVPMGMFPDLAGAARLYTIPLRSKKGGDMTEWPEDIRVREFPR